MVSRFVREVRTASGAVAVQIVTRQARRVTDVDHVGSAHTDAELALLVQTAKVRLHPEQTALDLGELAQELERIDDVAYWTSSGRLDVSAQSRRCRLATVAGGGRVVRGHGIVDSLASTGGPILSSGLRRPR